MSDGVIRQYSFAARNWTERRMPSGDMLKIVAQPNNVLGVHVKGLISVRYLSRDGGATWNKIDAPFSQELVPYLTPAGTVLSIEADSRQARLHASKDSGKTWQQLSADLGRVEDLVVLPTAGLFALTPDWGTADFIATIKHSADGGATWKTEYSTADQPRRQAQKSD
jgi:photosystem II stability/assembly factor-like uncharacterized protein